MLSRLHLLLCCCVLFVMRPIVCVKLCENAVALLLLACHKWFQFTIVVDQQVLSRRRYVCTLSHHLHLGIDAYLYIYGQMLSADV